MSKASTMRRAASGACLMVLLQLQNHAVQAKAPVGLTAMDYIQIQQLVNRLSFALDYCTNGGQDFADLFING